MNFDQRLIYESPDGGDTIYVREPGHTQKQLHSISENKLKQIEFDNQLNLWKKIIELSLTDKNLAEELNRVKLLYYLKIDGSKT